MEEIKQILTFELDFKCPSCNEGYLRPIGTILAAHLPILMYPHRCNNIACGYVEDFKVNYPQIIVKYLPVEKFPE